MTGDTENKCSFSGLSYTVGIAGFAEYNGEGYEQGNRTWRFALVME